MYALQKYGNDNTCSLGILGGLNEIIYRSKCLTQHLVVGEAQQVATFLTVQNMRPREIK